ncbi:MAG TPA: FecR domain-containing protein [Rhizomicrobium sp.]
MEIHAEEVDACAAAWLERRDSDGWREADQFELDSWLAQSIAHRVSYWRLKAAWGRTERLSVLRGAMAPERSVGERLRTLLGRSAAIVCMAAVAGAVSYFYPRTDEWTYSTPLGGHEIVHLGDGTQIELNTDTVIRVANEGAGRQVWLDRGEAYFQVRHDASRPFTVMALAHRITDLGTKFVVRQDGTRVEVSLIEGRARFESTRSATETHSTVLSPGDVIVATADAVSLSRTSAHALDAELGWRRDVLIFDHTSLAAAADEFNRYNKEKLVIADSKIAAHTIGGTFPKNGLADFADVARGMLGLKVTKTGDEIVISR